MVQSKDSQLRALNAQSGLHLRSFLSVARYYPYSIVTDRIIDCGRTERGQHLSRDATIVCLNVKLVLERQKFA